MLFQNVGPMMMTRGGTQVGRLRTMVNNLRRARVPFVLDEFVVRFVVKLEIYLRRLFQLCNARRFVFPQALKPGQMFIRVRVHRIVMMHVDDDVEPVLQELARSPNPRGSANFASMV